MKKKTEQTMGERLQKLRKDAGYTQSDLSKQIGISHTQLTRYELRGVQPPADVLQKFADVFGTSIDYLVRGDKDKHAGTLIQDAELISQFRMIDELPKDEKSVVSKFIGAYLRDYKARKTYQTA